MDTGESKELGNRVLNITKLIGETQDLLQEFAT